MTIVALDPTGGPIDATARKRLAGRPSSLAGQRLGLVVNGLGYSERFLDALADELCATTDLDGVVKVVKSSVSVPPDPGDWSRLTEGATVAITGFGG
jgi:hypothetical protein